MIAFDGGWNLPVWAAQRQGFFEANGVTVQISWTPSSAYLISALLDDRFEIALAGIDNLVAYQEGQGEAKIADNPDLFAFLGNDNGFASIVAAPAVAKFADLKGKTVSVDAMTTGYAFVVRELLARNGVSETDVTYVRAGGTSNRYRELLAGKHDATLMRTPFELLLRERGFHQLATAETLGAYQGTVRRSRGEAGRLVTRKSSSASSAATGRASIGSTTANNRAIVEAILVANIRDMTPALAKQSYDLLLADKGGMTRDAALDLDGIRTVLVLRSKYGSPRKTLDDPAKYVDLTYYEKALGKR